MSAQDKMIQNNKALKTEFDTINITMKTSMQEFNDAIMNLNKIDQNLREEEIPRI